VKVLLALVLLAAANPPSDRGIVPLDTKFAKQAASLQQRRAGFDAIFQQLCRATLDESAKNPKLRLEDCARSMFGGLWLWMRDGGNPSLQGRKDSAQHFIGGGLFEGYWDSGNRAAIRKEQLDTRDPHNYFDLDDLAATMLGSRWMDLATGERGREWIEMWATGKLTLSRSLPKLNYGHLPPGTQATSEQIRAIREAVDSALKLPGH
jgi:hypothetical protein